VLSGRIAGRVTGWLAVCVLVVSAGCSYNYHTNMGHTEKWVASDVHMIPKTVGTPILSIVDGILSPFTMIGDQIFRGEQYHPDHHYLTYAGSRTIARSHMGLGYQAVASIFTIPIETVFLPITGLIDLFGVMFFGDDGAAEDD